MIVKQTIGRAALALAALGIVSGAAVWSWTACPSSACDREAVETHDESPAITTKVKKSVPPAAHEPVAKAPAEVRRLRAKIRTGPLMKRPSDNRTITVEPVEPNEEEE